jgi:hypothetical protein
MSVKALLIAAVFFFLVNLILPQTSKAASLQEVLISGQSVIVKIQERVEYLFAFTNEKKVNVLEKQAEKRLNKAQNYANNGDAAGVLNLLQNYLQIKNQQDGLLAKTADKEVIDGVGERTIEQQKTMEVIKNKIDKNGKEGVMDVQEQVVNQVAKRIIEINGKEGQTEFFSKVEHVWAPGTGPGGEAGTTFAPGTSGNGSGGVTIKGGGSQYAPGTSAGGSGGVVVVGGTIQFASGTSAGGASGSDIKTQEIKTGGVSNDVPVNNSGGGNWAPGTTQGGSGGNTIDAGDGGGLAPGTTLEGKNELAP